MTFLRKLTKWFLVIGLGPLCALPLGATPVAAPPATSEAALIGMLYDLKQTDQGKPTRMDSGVYDKTMAEFITKGWDEHVLNRYYRVAKPLYTTQVFIPMIGDNLAPKAIGVESKIKDGYWVAHFKGQVVPPKSGRYRFVGYAHATMFVAINGKLVLNGSRYDLRGVMKDFPLFSAQKTSDPHGANAGDWILSLGSWVDLKANEPVDIDILFGNRIFSELCAFLLVEREGETYETDPVTHYPVLPLFQLSRYDGDLFQGKLSTKCKVNSMIWTCLQ